jgi:hypothetical protein
MLLFTHDTLVHAFETGDGILQEISRETQVLLIDASSSLSGKGDFFLDTVGLSDSGSNAPADIVAASLAPLLSHPAVTSATAIY